MTNDIHLLSVGGRNVLYHAITTKAFLLTDAQRNAWQEGRPLQEVFSEEEHALLDQKGFLPGPNEFDLSACIAKNHQERPDVFALYLILTEQCNMNCAYCSQSSFRTRSRMGNMSTDVLASVLEKFYATHTKRRRTVVLYGGEPTLNRPGIEYAVNHIRQTRRDETTEIVIFTNGLLLDEALALFLKHGDVHIILSLDGHPEINDQCRCIGHEGSFAHIQKAIELLQKHQIPFGISSTIAAHNVQRLGEETAWMYETYHPFSLGLNPIHYVPEERKALSVEPGLMADKMIEAYQTARRYGLYIEQIMRRVRPFVLGRPRLKDCPACGGMIRALPDGSFGPCGHFMEEQKERERASTGFADGTVMKKWNTRLNASMKDCQGCPAIALCGGGCPYNSLKNGGHIFTANDERSCEQARHILHWLLEELVREFPADTFQEIRAEDKKRLLGKIDLSVPVPMSGYSRYGEFSVDERFL